MAELQRYKNFVLTYNSTTGTFQVGAGAIVYVFTEGADPSSSQQISNAAGQTINCFDVGSFAVNDWVQIGCNGPIRKVTSVTPSGPSIAVDSGTAVNVTIATHLINVGTAQDRSASHAVIYSVDQDTATALLNSKTTADPAGNFEFYAGSGDYDVVMRNAGDTLDLAFDNNVSLFLFNRATSAGIGGATALTYLQNANDDFAVGFGTLTANAFYVDTSAQQAIIGGTTTTNITLDGSAGVITLDKSGAVPSIRFFQTGVGGTLIPAGGTAQTWTLPALTGTLLVSAAQTIAGAQIFSGAITAQSTLGVTGITTLAGGLVVTGATSDNKRVLSGQGSAIVAGNVVLSGTAFGATPGATTITTNSRDQRMEFTATIAASPSGTAGTVTITYVDPPWGTAPFVVATRSGGTGTVAVSLITWAVTTTVCTLTVTFASTPTAGHLYNFTVISWG